MTQGAGAMEAAAGSCDSQLCLKEQARVLIAVKALRVYLLDTRNA